MTVIGSAIGRRLQHFGLGDGEFVDCIGDNRRSVVGFKGLIVGLLALY